VAVSDQNHGGVPVTVAVVLGRLGGPGNLGIRQILAGTQLGIWPPTQVSPASPGSIISKTIARIAIGIRGCCACAFPDPRPFYPRLCCKTPFEANREP
jgi:hypothetical protein